MNISGLVTVHDKKMNNRKILTTEILKDVTEPIKYIYRGVESIIHIYIHTPLYMICVYIIYLVKGRI